MENYNKYTKIGLNDGIWEIMTKDPKGRWNYLSVTFDSREDAEEHCKEIEEGIEYCIESNGR